MRERTESSQVWRTLPAEVAVLLRPRLDQAVAEMIDAIQRGVPEYARPLDASYTDAISRAVRHSVEQFIERVADPEASFDEIVAEFRAIGGVEAREGRSLERCRTRCGSAPGWRGAGCAPRRASRAWTCRCWGASARPYSCTSTSWPRPARPATPKRGRGSRGSASGGLGGCST